MQALSDHIPVSYTFVMSEQSNIGHQKLTFFKMDGDMLENKEIAEFVKKLWMEQQKPERDPRINLDLACGAISQFLRGEKKRQMDVQAEDNRGERLKQLLQTMRRAPTLDHIQDLDREENQARQNETQEAKLLRRKSRVRWLKLGERPF